MSLHRVLSFHIYRMLRENPRARHFWQGAGCFAKRWASCIVLLVVLVPVTLRPPYSNRPPIRSDGLGYHLWTRAVLDRDLSFCQYRDLLKGVGALSREDAARGICQNKFPPGLALLRFPVMAALVDRTPGAPVVSTAEHQANLILSALALLGVCAVCLRSCLLLSVRPWEAHVAALALVFGTGLFHYGTYDASFTHIYSALGLALLLFLALRARVTDTPWPALTVAVIVFFLVSIRITNVVMLAVLLTGDILWIRADRAQGSNVRWPLAAHREVWPVIAGLAVALALQLVYNRYAVGAFVFSSYGGERFYFERPMQHAVLLSYERGLFTYYPVVAIALVSAYMAQRIRWAALWFASLIVAYAGVYGFWHVWYLGGGFGHRGFVELMPFGIVLFAVALSDIKGRPRISVTVLMVISIFVTLELMLGYWRGTLPFVGTTGQVYWSHVLGPHSLLSEIQRIF